MAYVRLPLLIKCLSSYIKMLVLTHSRRALFRVFDIGFGQIEDILGIVKQQYL